MLPPFPVDVQRYLEWDLSARRPWEDDLIDAHQWEIARAVQAAFREGQQSARTGYEAEQKAHERIAGLRGQAAC